MHTLRKDIRVYIEKIIRVNVVRYALTTIWRWFVFTWLRKNLETPTLYIYLFNAIIVQIKLWSSKVLKICMMFQQVIFKNINPFSVSGEMIISNHKYSMSEVKTSVYSVQMRLVIMNLQKQDLGGYKCISKNSIGDAEGNIRLYGEFSWIIRLRGSQTLNFSAFQLLPLPPFMFTYQKEFFFFATTGTPP